MMPSTIVEDLSRLALFRGLPSSVIARLASRVAERRLGTDEILCRKGDAGDALYMIRSGRVKVTTVDPQGNELVLNQCEPGEVIGELSLIDSSPRSATAIAMEPVQLLVLERQAFLDELGEHPALTMNVMRMVAARLRYLNTYIEKAIEWSRRVADGDYGEAIRDLHDDQSPGGAVSSPDEARAAELLRAFFRLVEQVRAREDALRRQVRELEIQIDEGKRRQDVETLTGTDFFAHLKARSEELRRERSEREGAGE